ncbi:hypothetical protein Naga_104160g1, partial [Nannochloropsis gaditana]
GGGLLREGSGGGREGWTQPLLVLLAALTWWLECQMPFMGILRFWVHNPLLPCSPPSHPPALLPSFQATVLAHGTKQDASNPAHAGGGIAANTRSTEPSLAAAAVEGNGAFDG